ncbi:MAG TPA: CoA pyrophosphatase [Candidatus Kapabacteria bacterium]|nr:CoA pyrophosphatase [Candidatus Kapabacteria bacterium]
MLSSDIQFIDFLKLRLQEPLPGIDSQINMAMKVNNLLFRKFKPTQDAFQSSIMLLLSGKTQLSILFTLRSKNLRHHNNQISFPGGRNEKGEDSIEAAIRETYEETDIMVDKNQIIGKLSELFVPPSNSIITPIIAYTESIEHYRASPDEVEEIFFSDMITFTKNDIIQTTIKNIDGNEVVTPYWNVHNLVPLWGATAMILNELVDLYKEWLSIKK